MGAAGAEAFGGEPTTNSADRDVRKAVTWTHAPIRCARHSGEVMSPVFWMSMRLQHNPGAQRQRVRHPAGMFQSCRFFALASIKEKGS
jgi:hypothetical protein